MLMLLVEVILIILILNDCKTQRNLSDTGREQANKIGYFFRETIFRLIKFILVSGADVKKQH